MKAFCAVLWSKNSSGNEFLIETLYRELTLRADCDRSIPKKKRERKKQKGRKMEGIRDSRSSHFLRIGSAYLQVA